MDITKIPFETEYVQAPFSGEMMLLFVASRTCVFTRDGTQYTTISHDECVELLGTRVALRFSARISLNVLIVLKVGI